jgi:putative ABC transport system substrate-binding protein
VSGFDGIAARPTAPLEARRRFGARLGAVLGLFAVAAAADPLPRAYRIGILIEAWSAGHPTVLGFKAGLRDLGLAEGRDVTFDIRHTEGKRESTASAAAALVDSGVDLLFACGVAAALAAKAASSRLPIVFAQVNDPIAARVVRELDRPGDNVTGVSSLGNELMGKRVELLKTLQPGVRRAWLIHAVDDPAAAAARARISEAAPRFGVTILARAIPGAAGRAAGRRLFRTGDALLTPDDAAPDISAGLLKLSLEARLAAIFPSSFWVGYGALASYGPDSFAHGMQAARLAAKVMQGAPPGALPVEAADAIDLAVNLRTASLMNIDVPRKVLLRADTIRR